MSRRLRIQMMVPLGLRGPVFHRWLPLGVNRNIRLQRDGLELSLWFDVKSAQRVKDLSEEEIPYHVNLTTHRIYADIITATRDVELLSYMSSRDFSRQPTQEEVSLTERYESHGREVFSLLRDGINRLLTFIRTEKGQFWLDPFEIDLENMSSSAIEFEAKAQVDDGPWFRWQPTQTSRITVTMPRDPDPRFLVPADWPKAQAFVTSERGPDLTRQLLAAAEAFAAAGSRRVALTEAVTALEVALSEFAKSPKLEYFSSESSRALLEQANLKKLQKRLRLTASVDLLLPILFDSSQTRKTLDDCKQAIKERNKVVHEGHQPVDHDKLSCFLGEIRKLCEILQDATVTNNG